jgi:hypothetical protein
VKKCIFSIILALCIAFILIPSSVYADGFSSGNSQIISRYTVLVLDVSGSMKNTPISTLKTAANKFYEAISK